VDADCNDGDFCTDDFCGLNPEATHNCTNVPKIGEPLCP
jgi:hypothetical protein